MRRTIFEYILTILGLIVGTYLIIFRKSFIRGLYESQIRKAKPEKKAQFEEFKKTEYGWIPYKIGEIAVLVGGLVFLLSSITDIFFPTAQKYIGYVAILVVLSIFAAVGAILFMLPILPFLWRKARNYTKEKYFEFYQKANNPPMEERFAFMKSGEKIDDPVLRNLRINAMIYTVACFSVLFIVLLFVLYTIIRVTS